MDTWEMVMREFFSGTVRQKIIGCDETFEFSEWDFMAIALRKADLVMRIYCNKDCWRYG